MNKRIFLSIFSVGLAIGISALPFLAHAKQGDPIPGVDVSVEQSPIGIKVGTTQTNASGTFTFGHLVPGQYVVKFTPPKPKAGVSQNYNSSKSNTAGIVADDGSTLTKVTIELFDTEKGMSPMPITVTIGAKGGAIQGMVTEGMPDESLWQQLLHGITRFFASVGDRIRHPLGGGSTPSEETTPTVSPTQSVTPMPTSIRTTTPQPQSNKGTPTPTQAGQTPVATSSPSTGSTSTSTPVPSMTPTPTPNTAVTFISLYPKSVSSGQDFAINGTNFLVGRSTSQVSAVKLNGVSISFGAIDAQTIFATASGEHGTYDVSIVTTSGETLTLKGALTIQ